MSETETKQRTAPAITVDVVVLTIREQRLQVLLIRRGRPPFEGRWALPGGFVDPAESLHAAARRELKEETGVSEIYLEQLYSFGEPDRDPRGRVISVAHLALVPAERVHPVADDDAAEVGWFPVSPSPPLAFDHDQILSAAVERLRNKLGYTLVAFQLLPPRFTLGELQEVYEICLERRLDKRNFRRKILSRGVLKPWDGERRTGPHRPAKVYSPVPDASGRLKEKGTIFTS